MVFDITVKYHKDWQYINWYWMFDSINIPNGSLFSPTKFFFWCYSWSLHSIFMILYHTKACLDHLLILFSLILQPGKKWPSLSVFPCNECCHWAKRRQASLDWSPHCCWCLLQWLSWSVGLEVRKSVWGIPEVQGRKIHSWKVKNCYGELVAFPSAALFPNPFILFMM